MFDEVEHEKDVNALQVVADRDDELLFSASSTGEVFAYRLLGADCTTMTDGDPVGPLSVRAVPKWEQVVAGTPSTCVKVIENCTSLVTASTNGALAWP